MGNNTFLNVTTPITNLIYSGTNGGSVTVGGYAKTTIQVGGDNSATAPLITFPIPFKSGTSPAVYLTVLGTSNTTTENPIVSSLTNSSFEIQKKQRNSSGTLSLANYQILWMAIGEVD